MIAIDLTGRRALVTGASGGLGQAIAEILAAAGAQVAVHYRKGQAEAEQVVAAIQGKGVKAQAFQADISDPAAVEKLLQEIDGEDFFPDLGIVIADDGAGTIHASIVDEEIEAAKGAIDLLQQLFDGGRIGNVGLEGLRLAAFALDGGDDLFGLSLPFAVMNGDLGAGGRQNFGDGLAQTTARAGDQGTASGKIDGNHAFSPCRVMLKSSPCHWSVSRQ